MGNRMTKIKLSPLMAFIGHWEIRASGRGLLLPVVAALAVTACSPETQSNAHAEEADEKVEAKVEVVHGTIEQRAIAEEMRGLVLARGIAQRLSEMCADFRIDESKMNAERQRLMSAAQKQFSSQKEFLDAAGAGDPAKTGEDMRRFFLDRGVKWESPPKDYCTLAQALHRDEASAGKYLVRRE